jgi:aminoglycoside 6'-N-acetyltransferase
MRDDLPLLRRWLQTPEVARWWDDPDRQFANLESDLDEPRMTMLIVTFQGKPFAYAQHYELQSWPQPQFAHFPAGSRAIDTFIGEPDMIGVGHGSAYLRLLAERLLAAGAPLVAVDPDPENLRARRAYARAGFSEDVVVETEEGPAVIMTLGEPVG